MQQLIQDLNLNLLLRLGSLAILLDVLRLLSSLNLTVLFFVAVDFSLFFIYNFS